MVELDCVFFCQCDGILVEMGIALSYTVCKRAIIRCLNCDRRATRPLSVKYTLREVGEPKSLEYRVYFYDQDGNIVSEVYCVKLIVFHFFSLFFFQKMNSIFQLMSIKLFVHAIENICCFLNFQDINANVFGNSWTLRFWQVILHISFWTKVIFWALFI